AFDDRVVFVKLLEPLGHLLEPAPALGPGGVEIVPGVPQILADWRFLDKVFVAVIGERIKDLWQGRVLRFFEEVLFPGNAGPGAGSRQSHIEAGIHLGAAAIAVAATGDGTEDNDGNRLAGATIETLVSLDAA